MQTQATAAGRRARAWPMPLAWLAPLLFLAWMPVTALAAPKTDVIVLVNGDRQRSEERRVGKECRSRWSPYH